jgi:phage terminase large subunit-like protein
MHSILLTTRGASKAFRWLTKAAKDGTWVVEFKKATKDRTIAMNRTQFLWCKEAAQQRDDDTAEGYRAYCKLNFGVSILRAENDEYRDIYDRIVRPHSYEEKLELMSVPIDFPVTRLMTTKQFSEYMRQMWNHFTQLGIVLSDPLGDIGS